jgi:MerR family transcriptional regulator/heat shock protein HspR
MLGSEVVLQICLSNVAHKELCAGESMLDEVRPVYTIGTAAEILGVHPRTLRLYEDGGLIRPARKNNRRFYSAADLKWISSVRYMIHEKGLNQEGLRRLLALIPCADIKGCSEDARANCSAPTERSTSCWDLARKAGDQSRCCHECQVYLSAWEHVLDQSEREKALDYAVAD